MPTIVVSVLPVNLLYLLYFLTVVLPCEIEQKGKFMISVSVKLCVVLACLYFSLFLLLLYVHFQASIFFSIEPANSVTGLVLKFVASAAQGFRSSA